ncbi:TetR family transcriptional regulator [Microbacterium sp. B35-04]|uniref:TetR/AcrR family transcriptional regulator n=1 Tax=unclassified Microbacterium TaxID=2609290 RepID=UPI0013D76D99|nr:MULTISPECIES: helix-turn-helix domain-containing protein [unclassified Microbacterium]KAF2412985.1 TetR family transcriptional regulator [Microbacterium sp. B35-04]KAF2420492.1 TetR family transcriptional regulator [Microbacterium sp. B35-30]
MDSRIDAARRPRRDALENRAGILAAALVALAHDPRASVDAIARQAGLSRRALYGHFDDRDALVRELVTQGAQRFNAIAATVDDADPRVALARLAAALWTEASHVQVLAAIALDEAHLEETATALAPLRRTVVRMVREGQEAEVLRTDVAAPTLARLVEETARTVITRMDASSPAARDLAVRSVLSIAGLSWREAAALLEAHPDVLVPATAATPEAPGA